MSRERRRVIGATVRGAVNSGVVGGEKRRYGMAKDTTIRLTPEQKEQIRKLTGQEHEEVKVETVHAKGGSELAERQVATGQLRRRAVFQGKRLAPSAKRLAPSAKRLAPSAKRLAPSAKRLAPAAKRRLAPTGKRMALTGKRLAPTGKRMA